MLGHRLYHVALIIVLGLLGACASAPERGVQAAAAGAPAVAASVATPVSSTSTAVRATRSATPAKPQVAPAATRPATSAAPARRDTRTSEPSLTTRIDAFIAQPRFAHATWGIDVVDASSGRVRYSHNANKLAVPASNTKLYTTALALLTLGGDARFTTSLYATAAPRGNGTLVGDIILHGGGDPSLGNRRVAPASADWAEQFAAALAARGIHQINGDLIADDTLFQGPDIGSGWEAGDLQSWYATRVSALSVRGNVIVAQVTRKRTGCCDVTLKPADTARVFNLTHATKPGDRGIGIYRPAGSNALYVSGSLVRSRASRRFVLAAPDPAMMAAQLLHDAMIEQGIVLNGNVRAVHWPQVDAAMARAGLKTIAQLRSPPLRHLVAHTLKHSDNLYAQTLLLQVGVATARAGTCNDRVMPPRTSEQWGLCALRAMLRRARIDGGQATFVEGSGLSRKDLVTPAATTSLLMWISHQPFATDMLAALPIAGVDGTLKHRLKNTLAANNLRGKTGTLTHAYALSGYVTDADGTPLVFSLSLNHYQRPRDSLGRRIAPSPNSDLDTIAAMIAEHHRHQPAPQPTPTP